MQSLPQNIYTKTTHTHTLQGTCKGTSGIINYKKDKLNYTINIILIREVYSATEENMLLNKTLGTRPLLDMTLHTDKRKNTMYRKG